MSPSEKRNKRKRNLDEYFRESTRSLDLGEGQDTSDWDYTCDVGQEHSVGYQEEHSEKDSGFDLNARMQSYISCGSHKSSSNGQDKFKERELESFKEEFDVEEEQVVEIQMHKSIRKSAKNFPALSKASSNCSASNWFEDNFVSLNKTNKEATLSSNYQSIRSDNSETIVKFGSHINYSSKASDVNSKLNSFGNSLSRLSHTKSHGTLPPKSVIALSLTL